MKRLPLLSLLALTAPLAAQDEAPPLRVELQPWRSVSPYHHRLVLESTRDQQVVADRRLLSLRVRPEGSRRRYTCRHPQAPRRVDEGRARSMSAGERHEEWVDLRMYCWGRALSALNDGSATIEVAYGFRGAGRTRWVARVPDERRPARRISGAELAWQPPPEPRPNPVRGESSTETESSETEGEPRLEVTLRPTTQRGRVTLRVGVRSVEGIERAYLRDDLFWLTVRGPLGEVECRPVRQPVVPIVDFYKRVGRRGLGSTVAAEAYCPEDTFEITGVYEVTPAVDLIYDGERYEIDAVTGTLAGEATPVRVLRGRYVEQRPEDLLSVLAGEEAESP